MSEKRCPPLVMVLLGFLLGVIAAKLAERFCPLCRGESCSCGEGGEPCSGEEDEFEAAEEAAEQ